ncbi:hypothetical protein HCJ39_07000 [Listeria rocourtiae]|uniref:hypothetical protein n=1 Tax=Listeria rocourtiae TaxID=647910 RepID=UPI001628E686|nr:hypothetical protein [Listeria rocourtiae]MBC1604457.1 hypothetical protein [Listeria rocourtiae]
MNIKTSRLKKASLALLTGFTVLSLTACSQGKAEEQVSPAPVEETKEAKTTKAEVTAENSFSDPEVAAQIFMDSVFGNKTSRIKELTHVTPEQFKEMQLDLFRENGSLQIPEGWYLEADGSRYAASEILESYAKTMVSMYGDITDYKVISSEKMDAGAEVKVSVRGLAGKGLGQASREVTEQYLGPDAYKYNGTDNKKLNSIMQLVNFWSLASYYDHGGETPIVTEPVTFSVYFEKDKHGEYFPAEDTLKDLYKGAYSEGDYQDQISEKSDITTEKQDL